MKTQLLVMIFALSSFVTYAQYTAIPDSNFEQVLIDQTIDSEGGAPDGQILTSDIASVTNLAFSSGLGITDLTGIEDFTALTRLVCAGNNIDILDLSNNLQLDEVVCDNNGMSSLILPNSSLLRDLKCWNNNLSSIDVSNNTGLELFWCYNNNLINTLDISANTALTHFQCHQNNIQTLLLPASMSLTWVKCDFNSLTSLDVTALPNLEYLNFIQNSIPTIDLTSNSKLKNLFCTLSGITGTLDLNANILLERADCDRNSITSLILPSTNTLTKLRCWGNDLTSLNTTTLTGLQFLKCDSNPNLSNLTLPNTVSLSELYTWGCNLSSLDFTNNIGLQFLDVGINSFTNLDISMLPALIEFYCNENQLASLNLKNGANGTLDWMWAQDNPSLTCIQVDDVAQAIAKPNWSKDAGASYNTNCALGIDEFNESRLALFPNPTKNKFTIDIDRDAKYSLISTQGQALRTGTLFSGINELDIQSLSNGLYFLNIETTEGKITKKLIKE